MTETHRWLSGVSLLVGAWIFVSAFVFNLSSGHFASAVVVGPVITVLAAYSLWRRSPSTATSGLMVLLGVWMVIVPFMYGTPPNALFWSDILSGLVVAALAGYNTYEASEIREERTTEQTA